MEPAVRRDSFWGDFLNALLLRPPYREAPGQPVSTVTIFTSDGHEVMLIPQDHGSVQVVISTSDDYLAAVTLDSIDVRTLTLALLEAIK